MMTSETIKEKKEQILVIIDNAKEEKQRTEQQITDCKQKKKDIENELTQRISDFKQKKIELEKLIFDSKNEIKQIETKLKQKYTCAFCEKVCSSLVYYQKHLAIHVERIQCGICLKYFEDQDELNHHLVATKNGMNGCRCTILNMKGQQCKTILTSRNSYRNHCPHSRGFSIKYK